MSRFGGFKGRRRLVPAALLSSWVCLLSACATPQASQLSQDFPPGSASRLSAAGLGAGLAASAEIRNLRFFAQEDFQCGPAALATLAQHAGVDVQPEDLVAQVYVPGRRGSFQVEMLAAARRQALVAYPLRPQLEDVLREVASGNPVLVFQNLSLPVYPVWHYAVVMGFDRKRNTVMLHSGVTERLEMSIFTFERTWARGGHWAMLALQPSRLPATAHPERYLAAVAALESGQPAAASIAYSVALQAWPGQRTALFGLGNAAYALGQKEAAAAHFEAATQQHPDFAEAWYNLAQVRLALGQLTLAAQAAKQAVLKGDDQFAQVGQVGRGDQVSRGDRVDRYRALLEKIRQLEKLSALEKLS
jgi:tetratricopeptide (TPR) repeat protein